jgi:endonuclease YncB( thermonuclease family)
MRVALLTFAALVCAVPAVAETLSGPPKFIDGDSFEITGRGVRLFGIDAPEAHQSCDRGGEVWACGEESAQQLRQAVGTSPVTCTGNERDQYGRLLAVCTIDGVDLNRYLVARGWATAFRRYSQDYVPDEMRARAAKLGIWSSNFVLPEDYRNPPTEVAAGRTAQGLLAQRQSHTSRAAAPVVGSVYFRNCNEARAAGAAPLYRGQPGYRPEMDGDGDGIACEPFRGRR